MPLSYSFFSLYVCKPVLPQTRSLFLHSIDNTMETKQADPVTSYFEAD